MANDSNDTNTTENINPNDEPLSEAEDHADVVATPEEQDQFRLAYAELAEERAALPADRLVHINMNIPTAVRRILGAMPRIRELGEQAEALPGFERADFVKLERYAGALAHAQYEYNIASEPIEEVPGLVEQAIQIRDRLAADATALSKRNLVDGSRLRELRGGNGYNDLSFDVGSLVVLLRKAWPSIQGKTAVSQAELTEAQILNEKMLKAIGAREVREKNISAAGDQRSRAFTLFVQAYDHAARAAAFLYWGKDYSHMLPSLFNRTGTGKRSKPETAEQEKTEQQSAQAATTPTNGSAAIPVGMPGASPLVD